MTKHSVTLHDRYINRRMPALGKEWHQICSCGDWQGPWTDDLEEAKRQRCPKEQPAVIGGK